MEDFIVGVPGGKAAQLGVNRNQKKRVPSKALPQWPHILQLDPPLKGSTNSQECQGLGTNPLTHGPLKDILDPKEIYKYKNM
jgi:hypothetical protein